jgi:single-stranded-DNA-specific exonuclease
VDGLVSPSTANAELLTYIEKVGPYGAQAPEPVFVIANARPNFPRRVGADHLSFEVQGEDGAKIRAIAFRAADEDMGQAILAGNVMNFVGKLKPDEWRGGGNVQFEVMDANIVN